MQNAQKISNDHSFRDERVAQTELRQINLPKFVACAGEDNLAYEVDTQIIETDGVAKDSLRCNEMFEAPDLSGSTSAFVEGEQ